MECPEYGRRHFPGLGGECPDLEACQQGMPCEVVRACAYRKSILRERDGVMTHGPADEAKARVDAALRDWWISTSERDMEKVVPKAVEYGSTDLAELGRTFALITGRNLVDLSHEEATEIGIYLYLVGKMSRWTDAIKNGRRPSRDTIYDGKIYFTMAERNLDVGGWPFPPNHEEDM